jgi:hypothetical protein
LFRCRVRVPLQRLPPAPQGRSQQAGEADLRNREPELGHFGIGGLPHGEQLLGMFMRKERIASVVDTAIDHVDDGRVVLADGTGIDFAYAETPSPFAPPRCSRPPSVNQPTCSWCKTTGASPATPTTNTPPAPRSPPQPTSTSARSPGRCRNPSPRRSTPSSAPTSGAAPPPRSTSPSPSTATAARSPASQPVHQQPRAAPTPRARRPDRIAPLAPPTRRSR